MVTLNETQTESSVSGLTPFTTYEVKVSAHTAVGGGPFTVIQTIQTHESGNYCSLFYVDAYIRVTIK